MQYRPLGATGMNLSRLGFGSMRLPMKEVDGSQRVDEDIAVPLMQRAFELGVNYM
ncbi:MAG: aldo/keto reductase, partial [Armatimonadetes bacterium]|nr:aldo/keto reductase [Armatimonadota bacterium]